jgi:hypothetical protein
MSEKIQTYINTVQDGHTQRALQAIFEAVDTELDALRTLANELRTDHATQKTSHDAMETLIEELHDDHATFKTSHDAMETLIEELHDDHATFKTAVDETKTFVDEIKDDFATILEGSGVVDVASIGADASASLTVTVTGAVLGDFALFSSGVDLAGLIGTCYVSAADTVTINLENQTAGAIDLASTTWKAKVFPAAAIAAMTAAKPTAGPATLTATKPASGPATLTATKPASGPATITAAAVTESLTS